MLRCATFTRCRRVTTKPMTRTSLYSLVPHYQFAQRNYFESSVSLGKQKTPTPPISVRDAIRFMLPILWPKDRADHRIRMGAALACIFGSKVFTTLSPLYLKAAIDTLSGSTIAVTGTANTFLLGFSMNTVISAFGTSATAFVIGYGLARVLASMCTELRTALFARVSADAYLVVTEKMFLKIHSLDMDFHLSQQSGTLARIVDRGSEAVTNLARYILFMLAPTALEMVLVITLLYHQVGPDIALMGVAAVILYAVWTALVTKWRSALRDEFNHRENKASAQVIDSLINFETVKYFGAEVHETQRLHRTNASMLEMRVKLDQSLAILNLGQQLAFAVFTTLAVYVSVTRVLSGALTLGDLVLVNALMMQLYNPLSFLGTIYREVLTSSQNMQTMLKLLQTETSASLSTASLPMEQRGWHLTRGDIELRDVALSYVDRTGSTQEVLNNTSVKIKGGSCVAFVGPSGSGKSSIFRLLFRLFEPTRGSVYMDDRDISTIELSEVRHEISVVPQDVVLHHDTIRNNLAYARPDASEEDIQRAAQDASIHSTIMAMPNGYDTLVGERGLTLSGGERQRVAIARMLLKDSPIVLMDEATSALDTVTETHVMESIRNYHRHVDGHGLKRTIVMISHRLTATAACDQIFVLAKGGEVIEQGTHAELLAKGGVYHNMWKNQKHKST